MKVGSWRFISRVPAQRKTETSCSTCALLRPRGHRSVTKLRRRTHRSAKMTISESFLANLVDGPRKFRCSRLPRSEEHTSELQSLMRISYAVFCLKKKKNNNQATTQNNTDIPH